MRGLIDFFQVGQVKEKISTEKGWEAPQLKLIYSGWLLDLFGLYLLWLCLANSNLFSGKILQDDKTIETYNIEEKGFIVCMVSKVCISHAHFASVSNMASLP